MTKKSKTSGSPKKNTLEAPSPKENGSLQTDGLAKNTIIDVPMTEEPSPMQTNESDGTKPEAVAEIVEDKPVTIPEEISHDPEKPKGLAIKIDPTASAPAASTAVPTTADQALENGDNTAEQPNETPTTGNLRDAHFESMFNDDGMVDANDDIDFDLAFPNDTNGAGDLLNDSAFQNINVDNVDGTNNTTSNEDINTLLPGLENYVSDGNDFSMVELPTSANGFPGDVNAISAPTATSSAPAPADPAPIDSSFDDIFNFGNFGNADDELGDTGDMNEVGDFDDDWFKTEGM